MQCLDPQTVELKEALSWFRQSVELVYRRGLAYLTSVFFFFAVLFVVSQSTVLFTEMVSPVVTVSALIIFSAFAFFGILASLVILSHCSDHSENYRIKSLLNAFMPNQRVFFQMALLAVSCGLFFWYTTIILHPEKNLLTSSVGILEMLSSNDSMLAFIFSENAVFLYFSLIVFLIFRTFFSVPLILFHQLNYHDSQTLSQKAIIKNIKVLSQVMAIWIIAFLLCIQVAPLLATLLLPVFATFVYVSFRHIFWGQGSNERAKEVIAHVITSKAT